MSLQQSKTILAKLLATENIKVEFRKVETASFDVKTRTMTLPLWDDMSPELYDLLGGHEVGHALHTPAQGWHDALDEKVGKNFKTFLNVIEDARIERKIKEKFPGIRKSFFKGYGELLEKNFFGIRGVDVNGLLLIDRINLHYKIGSLAGVEFSTEEQVFIRRIDVAETWAEVVKIAKDLFAYCKQEMEEMRQEQMERMMSMKMNDFGESGDSEQGEKSDDDSDEESDDDFDFSDSGEEGDDEDGDESSPGYPQESDDSKEQLKGAGGTGYSHVYEGQDEPVSITDKNFQEKVKTLAQGKTVQNGFLPSFAKTDVSKVVIDWRKMYGNIADASSEYYKTTAFTQFESKNKNAISYLVKEFEMRKRAAELRRVSVSDTGMIDTNLLHSYKFSDNIFRKIATVAEGKNHGLVAMVDWSGSMQSNLAGTVEQFLILTMFCRKLNIPFEVYAFSDNDVQPDAFRWMDFSAQNVLDLRQGFQLLNLMSSRMSNLAFRKMANDLLNVAAAYSEYGQNYGYYARERREQIVNPKIALGGTPLNASIVALSKVVADFRIKNRLEIVNTVILTDGEDSDYLYTLNSTDKYRGLYAENAHTVSYIFDDETKKSYKIGPKGVTPTLLQILKARTGTNLVGFYVINNNKKYFDSAIYRLDNNMLQPARDKALREFRENGVFAMEGWGYDEYYLIPGGKAMEASDDSLEDILKDDKTGKVSTRRLSGAFLRLNQNRLNSRILLKKFIEKTT